MRVKMYLTGIKNYIRVFSYGTKLDTCLVTVCCVASIGSGLAFPLMNIIFGQLVGSFTNYFVPGTTTTAGEFQAEVNRLALYLSYLFFAKFVLSYISMLTIRISGLRISSKLRLTYLRALLTQQVSFIDGISPGKVSTQITTSSNTIQLAISQHFAMFFQSLGFAIGAYVIAFIKGPMLTLVASASFPFLLIFWSILIPPFVRIHKVTEKFHGDASAMAFEMFSSVRLLRAFGAEEKLAKQHRIMLTEAAKNGKKAAPIMGLMLSPTMVAQYGTFGLTFWFGIKQYSDGNNINVETITVVLFSVMMAVMNLSKLIAPVVSIIKASAAAAELFVIIDAPVPNTVGLKEPDVTAKANIAFQNISFSYPSRPSVQVLDGLNLEFQAGKITAIVGPSGSGKSKQSYKREFDQCLLGFKLIGKSTIVGLLQRWYDLLGTTASVSASSKDSANEPIPATKVLKKRKGHPLKSKWLTDRASSKSKNPEISGEKATHNQPDNEQAKLGSNICTGSIKIGNTCLEEVDRKWWRSQIGVVQQEPFLFNDTLYNNVAFGLSGTSYEDLPKEEKIKMVEDACREAYAEEFISKLPEGYETKVGESGIELSGGQRQQFEVDTDNALVINARTSGSEITRQSVEDTGHSKAIELDYKKQGLLRSFGRLLYEQRYHWILYSVAILGILASGAVYPLQAYIFANVINVFTFPKDKLIDQGYFWASMFGVLAGSTALSYFCMGAACHLISIAVTLEYRQEYLENLIQKRITFFDDQGHSPGSLTASLSSDSTQIQQLMATEMSMACVAVVSLIGCVIISFFYGWKLSLVGLFATLPLILVAGYLRMRQESEFEKSNAKVFEKSSQFAAEAIGAFRTVISLAMEDTIENRYETLLRGHVNEAFSRGKYSAIVFAASDSLDMACTALTFWYGGTLLASREYNNVKFFIIYQAIMQGAIAAGTFFSFAPNMAQATGAASRILSVRPETSIARPSYVPLNELSEGISVEFQNVCFTYKSRKTPVLSGLSLQVAPGQFAALVGASGCGKSTTMSLLERFYDASSGIILCNGQDITTLDPSEYRRHISLVSQEPTLYEGTIRDNIALSVVTASDEEIEQACRDAQIHSFIASLPDTYNERLGPKGISLSGGQKQRISLARALLRRPKLLLLDEATSSLDSESEKLVQEAVERAAKEGGRTIIAVSHRLATIQNADIIFVLGSGKVQEMGDHQTLLRKRGLYWQMCKAQALDR
ncbi:hypothetical protein GGP41_004490 [Bipolaris sorokiniana]|uniref:Uncharacterized protein n=1 Tax=Cochliobolus sativus TaxID=45130 RepID=A0A8H6DQC9_COCSA|nr:hypothetical protein GGP41_004490 [Bipolaris sorokiniana]